MYHCTGGIFLHLAVDRFSVGHLVREEGEREDRWEQQEESEPERSQIIYQENKN